MIRRPPRSTHQRHRRQRQMCIRDRTNSINEKMNKLENKYIDAYHVIFKEGNLNGEWCINDVNAVSKIAANAVNGIVTFTHEQNINERIKLMNKFSQIFLNGLSK